uniref:Protein kinase domain-containing protein n=1 Tax=Oryza punctata TaxID=4537 RepID=A0A0E0JDB1_ORYPU
MRGTPGYLAPEWLTSQITEKADVYSFSIVVMEIVSGRKNVDTSRSEQSIHLITLLQENVKSDQLVDLIDKDNNDMQVHKQEIDCKRRPQMSEVVKALEGTISIETNIVHDFIAVNPIVEYCNIVSFKKNTCHSNGGAKLIGAFRFEMCHGGSIQTSGGCHGGVETGRVGK